MNTTASYFCASCGVQNLAAIDLSAGLEQRYVEDCEICCRPNVLRISVNSDTEDVEIQADAES